VVRAALVATALPVDLATPAAGFTVEIPAAGLERILAKADDGAVLVVR
jgi:hypothetical protein